MGNYIRKYHIVCHKVFKSPEMVVDELDTAVYVLKEKYADYCRMYGESCYKRLNLYPIELCAYVYENKTKARKYDCLRVDYIWQGSYATIDQLDKEVENYKAKYLEVK